MFDLERFVALVPTSEPHLKRLNQLLRTVDAPPRIAALGKYNHGKSRLLNALAGTDHFKVADKRETVAIAEYEHDGVIWVDTPGLDSDPLGIDDREAWKAAFEIADYKFLVHAVTDGELDRYEIAAFTQLAKQDRNYRRKMALVLTKIDQDDPAKVSTVEKQCRAQLHESVDLRELDIMPVSAVRQQNSQLRSVSGMDCVVARVEWWKANIRALRCREWSRLTDGVLIELTEKQSDVQRELTTTGYRSDDIQKRLRSAATALVGKLREA